MMLESGHKQSKIAETIGVNRSTICRELKRNMSVQGPLAGVYVGERAHFKAEKRHQKKAKHIRMTGEMRKYIGKKLRNERWSPEIISGRGRLELGDFVSHETIYQYIWTMKWSNRTEHVQDKNLHAYLRHYGRRQKRKNKGQNRGCIPNRVSIDRRPAIVEQRVRYGDFEVDIMMGKDRKPGLIVMTDRTTRQTKLSKLNTKQSREVAMKIKRKLEGIKPLIQTLTFDNDLAFARHESIGNGLEASTYFTRPYTSQDKGSVENRIGVIRQFIPKGSNTHQIPFQTIKSIENKLNNRPMKMFAYLTPNEMLAKLNI